MPNLIVKDSMPKILIIDDEEGVRKTLKKIMEKEGYEVDTAENSKIAFKLLEKKSYDTIVTDIILPGMSGIELLKSIRENNPELPVIVITGYPNLDTATEAVRQMAYDYVSKPITKHNLPPIVARSVEKKKLSDEKKRLEKENLEYQQDLEKKVKSRTLKIEALNRLIKESQEKLILSERLATLGTFISFVSHDLRNPLSVIQNSIFYLKTHVKIDNPKIEKYFRIIEEEVGIANNIIDGFLNYTKGSALNIQSLSINELIERVLDILIQVPDNIELVFKFQKDLPKIGVDKDQIQQVFVNIINNAIQAMPQGGQLILSTSVDEKYCVVNVSDTGVGMTENDLHKLFNPFFSKKKKGTGLGLVICKFLINRHSGKITVRSKEGSGSTFTIYLPLDLKTTNPIL